MARKVSDDCMFCETGDCPTHSPKPTIKRLRAPYVRKQAPEKPTRPAPEVLPEPSRLATALQARVSADQDNQSVFDAAIRALAPILADGELIKYRRLLGTDVYLRANRWKRGR